MFRSPCDRIARLDYAVHIYLPALIRERHFDVASRLEDTSPRWGDKHNRPEPDVTVSLHPVLQSVLANVVGRGAVALETFRRL